MQNGKLLAIRSVSVEPQNQLDRCQQKKKKENKLGCTILAAYF